MAYVGHIITTTKCLYTLYHACDDIPGQHQSARITWRMPLHEAAVSTVEYVRIHADRLRAVALRMRDLRRAFWLEACRKRTPEQARAGIPGTGAPPRW